MSSGNSIPSIPSSLAINNNNHRINFNIEKLSKDNFDIKLWASELRLWIKYQKLYLLPVILTSIGETREVIQDMENDNDSSDDEEEEDSNQINTNGFPILDQIIKALETFYGIKEDQNILFRELRALKIKKNEKDFNIRYRPLYHKLDKKRKRKISVLDYAEQN
ncbi:hypothetical protein BCR32DRAFT_284520 [Anaeromyces robustus]|uniref:Uncharacterized protein n=1 Tax=Anaeromyces robustus TaxID=1754192 RepID=A0A1Y1WRF6_9FUNG|nr:hypothetical protein BCR32DRAFT_284520 [Anaeromyces robustus]|eukprot:ORX76117.1 hypothetical protein BCR32DRAFT_284520 [Anaeromyces robustus]